MNVLFTVAKNTDYSDIAERADRLTELGVSSPDHLAYVLDRIIQVLQHIDQLLIYGCYIGGIWFSIQALFAFARWGSDPNGSKQIESKNGNEQVGNSQGRGWVHLVIAACLVYLPDLIGIPGATLFGAGSLLTAKEAAGF